MRAPSAERGPAAEPSPVRSTFATTTNTDHRSEGLQLPPALERRLTDLEAEIADIRRCVLACRGEACPSACWTGAGS